MLISYWMCYQLLGTHCKTCLLLSQLRRCWSEFVKWFLTRYASLWEHQLLSLEKHLFSLVTMHLNVLSSLTKRRIFCAHKGKLNPSVYLLENKCFLLESGSRIFYYCPNSQGGTNCKTPSNASFIFCYYIYFVFSISYRKRRSSMLWPAVTCCLYGKCLFSVWAV